MISAMGNKYTPIGQAEVDKVRNAGDINSVLMTGYENNIANLSNTYDHAQNQLGNKVRELSAQLSPKDPTRNAAIQQQIQNLQRSWDPQAGTFSGYDPKLNPTHFPDHVASPLNQPATGGMAPPQTKSETNLKDILYGTDLQAILSLFPKNYDATNYEGTNFDEGMASSIGAITNPNQYFDNRDGEWKDKTFDYDPRVKDLMDQLTQLPTSFNNEADLYGYNPMWDSISTINLGGDSPGIEYGNRAPADHPAFQMANMLTPEARAGLMSDPKRAFLAMLGLLPAEAGALPAGYKQMIFNPLGISTGRFLTFKGRSGYKPEFADDVKWDPRYGLMIPNEAQWRDEQHNDFFGDTLLPGVMSLGAGALIGNIFGGLGSAVGGNLGGAAGATIGNTAGRLLGGAATGSLQGGDAISPLKLISAGLGLGADLGGYGGLTPELLDAAKRGVNIYDAYRRQNPLAIAGSAAGAFMGDGRGRA